MSVDFPLPKRLSSDLNFLANLPSIRFRRLDEERQTLISRVLTFIVDSAESDNNSNYIRIPATKCQELKELKGSELQLLATLIYMRCPWIQVGLCFNDDGDSVHTITVRLS